MAHPQRSTSGLLARRTDNGRVLVWTPRNSSEVSPRQAILLHIVKHRSLSVCRNYASTIRTHDNLSTEVPAIRLFHVSPQGYRMLVRRDLLGVTTKGNTHTVITLTYQSIL